MVLCGMSEGEAKDISSFNVIFSNPVLPFFGSEASKAWNFFKKTKTSYALIYFENPS